MMDLFGHDDGPLPCFEHEWQVVGQDMEECIQCGNVRIIFVKDGKLTESGIIMQANYRLEIYR